MDDLAKSCPTAALSEFHDKLLQVLEKLFQVKKKKSGNRPKMHRMRRLFWKKHAKAKRHIKSSSSIGKLSAQSSVLTTQLPAIWRKMRQFSESSQTQGQDRKLKPRLDHSWIHLLAYLTLHLTLLLNDLRPSIAVYFLSFPEGGIGHDSSLPFLMGLV
jgi:hypothetical protein